MISGKTAWCIRNNLLHSKTDVQKNQRYFSCRKSSLVSFLLLFTELQPGLPPVPLLRPEPLLSHTERLHSPSVH